MTILGCLVEPHRAIAWTDSEIFAGAAPAGHRPKLVLNPLSRVALIGTGSSTLLRSAEEAALREATLDETVPKITAALRRRAAVVAHDLTCRDRHWLAGQVAVVIGWSDQAGRMVALTFGGSAFFEPTLCGRFVLPQPADAPGPGSMTELVAYARRQVACLRESLPDACGGSLQVAELLEDRITTWVVPDFDVAQAAVVAREAESLG